MKNIQVEFTDPTGLHARPAALFVNTANQFHSEIQVSNLSKSGDWVNAKSILSLLTCGLEQGDLLGIQANGTDERQAIQALKDLILAGFNGASAAGK